MTRRLLFVVVVCAWSLLLILQFHNSTRYPTHKSFDAPGHIEYLQMLEKNFRVPLANEGWELYQPPLYYALHYWLPSLKLVQLAGVFWWMTLSAIAFATFKTLFKNRLLAASGALFVASLPVTIYLTPAIGNEFFSTVLISLSLAIYLNFKKSKTVFWAVKLGVVLGLSLLAKATAFVVLAAMTLDTILNWFRTKQLKYIKSLFLITIIALSMSGWFYARNFVHFGNPFQSSIDFPQFHIVQEPGYRDLKFFTDLSGFWRLDLFKAHWYSLIPGTYFSFFYDGHNAIIPVQAYSLAGVLLVAASLPFAGLIALGIVQSIKNRKKEKANVFIFYLTLLVAAYIAYNFKLPFYSTVKGAFVASLALPLGYFMLKGLQQLSLTYRQLFIVYQFGYALLIIKNFWILPHWF
jgi:4-amino-4-deoxy-L-arabinose transferase-like glycosyltransferase